MFSKQPIQNSSKSYLKLLQDLNEQQAEKVSGGGIGRSPSESLDGNVIQLSYPGDGEIAWSIGFADVVRPS